MEVLADLKSVTTKTSKCGSKHAKSDTLSTKNFLQSLILKHVNMSESKKISQFKIQESERKRRHRTVSSLFLVSQGVTKSTSEPGKSSLKVRRMTNLLVATAHLLFSAVYCALAAFERCGISFFVFFFD